ncbi:MAG: hypothetical protein DHS20C21_17830 [Gemmatimonadota bacterium]|nr:MAG: hypothetical protein DHS20C21_17830 [Gemmatimonadota bacterium]
MTRGLTVSLVLHVLAFVSFLVGPSPKAFEWDVEKIPVSLVAAVEIPAPEVLPDPVPEKKPEPKPEIQPPVVEKVVEQKVDEPPAQKPDPVPEPVKPAPRKVRPPRTFQRVAPKRSDDEPSLAERLRQRLDQATEPEATPPDAVEGTEPTDAVLPQPSAATTEVQATDFPFAWYLKQVQTRVRDSWDTPGDRLLAGHANQVQVTFVIHRDGRATGVVVQSGSGTPGLDTSAQRAVERAQPFPPLPEPYEGDSLVLTVRFTVAGGAR